MILNFKKCIHTLKQIKIIGAVNKFYSHPLDYSISCSESCVIFWWYRESVYLSNLLQYNINSNSVNVGIIKGHLNILTLLTFFLTSHCHIMYFHSMPIKSQISIDLTININLELLTHLPFLWSPFSPPFFVLFYLFCWFFTIICHFFSSACKLSWWISFNTYWLQILPENTVVYGSGYSR